MSLRNRTVLIKKIEKYYEENKENSVYFYPLALLHIKNNEKEKAYQILLEGIQRYPRYVLALLKIAEILIDEKKYKAALAYLETILQIQKDHTKALKLLALVYEQLKDYEKALKYYEILLELEPNNETVKSKIIELAPMIKPQTDNIEEILNELQDGEANIETKEENTEQVSKTIAQDVNIEVSEDINIDEIPQINLEETEPTDNKEYEENSEDENMETNAEEEEEATITLAKLYEKQGYIEDAIKTYKKILEKEPDNLEAKNELEKLEKMENQE